MMNNLTLRGSILSAFLLLCGSAGLQAQLFFLGGNIQIPPTHVGRSFDTTLRLGWFGSEGATIDIDPFTAPFSRTDGGGSFHMEPTEVRSIPVRFTPDRAGSFSMSVGAHAVLENNSRSDATTDIHASAVDSLAPPVLVVSPIDIDFGSVPIGMVTTRTFTIYNDNPANSPMGLTFVGPSEPFRLEGAQSGTTAIYDDIHYEFEVVFDRPSAGIYHDSILVITAGSRVDTVVVHLNGVAGTSSAPSRAGDRGELSIRHRHSGELVLFEGATASGSASIDLFTLDGRNVATVADMQRSSSGRFVASFDAGGLTPGIYLYRLSSEGASTTGTLRIVR
jgi:hypothetical protein